MVKILGSVIFSAFRIPRDQGSCKSALSSLVLGENQLHSIAAALHSTVYPAYLGTRHLVVTTGKESMPLFTLPLHLKKKSDLEIAKYLRHQ